MTDELRGPIGALAFSVRQKLCWGLDHNVGLDYWDSIEEPSFRHHSAIWTAQAGVSAGPGLRPWRACSPSRRRCGRCPNNSASRCTTPMSRVSRARRSPRSWTRPLEPSHPGSTGAEDDCASSWPTPRENEAMTLSCESDRYLGNGRGITDISNVPTEPCSR